MKLPIQTNSLQVSAGLCLSLGLLIALPAQGQQGAMPPGHPPIGGAAQHQAATPGANQVTGKVIETMEASSYTYVHVDTGVRTVWAAAPKFAVKVGDRVTVPTGSPMQNYKSDTLNRTFSLVYFAGSIEVAGASAGAPSGMSGQGASDRSTPHPGSNRAPKVEAQALAGISKPDGGLTVGEAYDRGAALAGNEVLMRGRVVKYSPRIMGTNWIHLQDGTEAADGRNDLVVTTDGAAAVGDLVLVRGTVSADKDFGYGYKYDLIVEKAAVTVE